MVVSVFLFDDFETMDAFMPVQLFGMLKEHFYVRMLSKNGGLMNSAQGVKVWTEPLNPIEIEDILVIPGGVGAKRLLNLDKDMQPLLRKAAENTDYCISIREGTGLLVQSGILYHRTAADYEGDENWKGLFTAGVNMVKGIRWAADGKFYSCSDLTRCTDMILGLISECLDIEYAQRIAGRIGFEWDSSDEGVLR